MYFGVSTEGTAQAIQQNQLPDFRILLVLFCLQKLANLYAMQDFLLLQEFDSLLRQIRDDLLAVLISCKLLNFRFIAQLQKKHP